MIHKCVFKTCSFLQYVRPAYLDKNIFCIWLHHNNPYLKLGPFHCEIKQKIPEMMVIHNFADANESSKVIGKAKGKLATTPLYTNSSQSVTNARTSKMMYQSEHVHPEVKGFADRIQLITKFKLYNEKFASENFKVMNYGLGGKVQAHWDATGNLTSKQSNLIFNA